MSYKKFSLVLGFLVWLFGTIPFSLWGDSFFLTNNLLVMLLLYFGIIPILYFLTSIVYTKFQLTKPEILEATMLMVLPGLVLDVLVFMNYQVVFPALTIFDAGSFISYVIWIYSIALILGLLKKSGKAHR
ncbi:DUF5367 family protein [Aquimarina longa]|uniref:DUF5367 family protein n=1 Tax=Aquimarina longa TaxID=1080221 RepID=UPI000784EE0B|nr:DUF5367 family protein [Aquimarina longa]